MGQTIQELSGMLGTKITTLLGTDILSNYKILFDYKNKVVEFSEQEIALAGTKTAISVFEGIPVIALSIKNQEFKFFLDTGAKLSYLPTNITSSYTSIAIVKDFYPSLGSFETPCFEISTQFGKQNFVAKYGNLPPLLQQLLSLGGVQGIIGFDFFNNYKVALDLKSQTMKCERQAG